MLFLLIVLPSNPNPSDNYNIFAAAINIPPRRTEWYGASPTTTFSFHHSPTTRLLDARLESNWNTRYAHMHSWRIRPPSCRVYLDFSNLLYIILLLLLNIIGAYEHVLFVLRFKYNRLPPQHVLQFIAKYIIL